MAHTHAKLIIIGSGPAGYTAAIYAARAMLEPVLISGFQPGGQLMITTDVENYPGFADVIQGPWLMEQMRMQAEHVGHANDSDHIVKADLGERPFRLEADSGATFTCDSLVIATGAQAKWLGLPSRGAVPGLRRVRLRHLRRVLFPRQRGGGGRRRQYGVEEALYLANLASKVVVVHRRDFRAERILQDRLFKHPNIEVVWNAAVEDIGGSEAPLSVNHVKLKNVVSGQVSELRTDGVFVAIGHKPSTELSSGSSI